MGEFVFRNASINDVPFLVETIIEAEKSGTDKLSYSTIFGLSEAEVHKYLSAILNEEVDGCELSISSFLIAECEGKVVAALSAWIEGAEGIPSTMLKGNLLSYHLPKKYIERAIRINNIIREIHVEYTPNTIQIGAVYVAIDYRGNNLFRLLYTEMIARLLKIKPEVPTVFVQIFSCNTPSIRAFEKTGFFEVLIKESSREEILQYLPFNKKILMKKELHT